MQAIIQKTTKSDQKIALDSIKAFKSRTKKKASTISIEIDNTGETITIPIKAFNLLKEVLLNMAEGNSIALFPTNSEISTQEAANILNISRPHFVKLLEIGEIPFIKIGTHRRVQLKDIVDYENRINKRKRKNLNLLSKQAQELKMGY